MKAISEKAQQIATMLKIFQKEDGSWSVPSQTGKGHRYRIEFSDEPHCNCVFHKTHDRKCKHIFAVEYILRQECTDDGFGNTTETVTVSRKVYSQNWSAYNASQTNEKEEFQELLASLCSNIEDTPQGNGRPRYPLGDAVFVSAFKVYTAVSSRRCISDLTDAQRKGHIRSVPHFNTISNYLELEELTPILTDLVKASSRPLAALETEFAVDSTGFTSSHQAAWCATKHGPMQEQKDWLKAHIVCGVLTNVVASIQVTEKNLHDSPLLPALVQETAENFRVEEVSADKGYLSRVNMEAIAALGATPYLAFKKNTKPTNSSDVWNRMYHMYSFKRDEYLAKYHKRSNVESTFMAVKAKFGEGVRSKTFVAQRNEVLCKFLCHNICCVIQSMREFGVEAKFGKAA